MVPYRLTVPSIWNEEAKEEMQICAQIAGLVEGQHCNDLDASPHPVVIILEPEAASFYCQRKADFPLYEGDKFLVVDAGGGTIDLVIHEKLGPPCSNKVQEVAPSSGGGTYVDTAFFNFLFQKIKCLKKFTKKNRQTIFKLKAWWETVKYNFDGTMPETGFYELELSPKLARAWEEEDASKTKRLNAAGSYDSILLTLDNMLSIFDPVVDKILQLITEQLIPDVKVMMFVGGFSGSPYLRNRVKAAFSQALGPGAFIFLESGGAICCGAVHAGLGGSNFVMARFAKKTYGIGTARTFCRGDPEFLKVTHDGYAWCKKEFKVFSRKGETILADFCVRHTVCPLNDDQTDSRITLYSTSETHPSYTTDPGTRTEGKFVVHHPSKKDLGRRPEIEVSMYFGRTTIEVKATGTNFGKGKHFVMPPVTFARSFKYLKI